MSAIALRCGRHPCIVLSEPGTTFFAEMSVRMLGEGGLVSEQYLQARFHRRGRCVDEVSHWIAEGRLRVIDWGRQRWLPTFQLTAECAIREDVAEVAEQLVGGMDDLEILAWFVCPNAALGRRTPLASLRFGLSEVIQAARLDHFLTSA